MKRFALLPALFALLLAAVLTGAAFAQQAPPGPTSPQAGDMIPDANTIAAFAAQSTPLESASNAETQWQILQHQAYGLAQGSQTAQSDLTTAQSATWESASQAAAQWQIAQRQAYGLAQGSQTAQLAPPHFDDSIEAPQVAAAMRAMAAVHVPSMEAIRLAMAAQAPQAGQSVGRPVVLPTEAASQVAILAEAGSQMAILQATPAQNAQTAQLATSHFTDSFEEAPQLAALQARRAAQGAQATQLMPARFTDSFEEAPPVAALQARRAAQAAQAAQVASSHYAALGALTSAQARALGLPALAGIKEMAEERYLMAILQNPTLLALVQAEEASQSQHVGLTVGELARLASDESQHEATESPIEAAFEAAEAAHNPGVSMLQVLP